MNVHALEKRFQETYDHFTQELNGIRTGRASPALVENIKVPCYQSVLPLKAVASISTPEANELVIEAWDASVVSDVERILSQSDIGAQPRREGNRLHVVLPMLTEERRAEFIRVASKKSEAAKISVRSIREDAMKALQKQQEEDHVSETMIDQGKKEVQKLVDKENERIDDALKKKKAELTTI